MGEISRATVTVKALMKRLWYECRDGVLYCTIYDEAGVRYGNAILDAQDNDPGVRRKCAGVWVTVRRSQIIDQNLTIDQNLAIPATYKLYFLVVVPVSWEMESSRWRRIGLGWTNYPGQRSDIEKSYIELI